MITPAMEPSALPMTRTPSTVEWTEDLEFKGSILQHSRIHDHNVTLRLRSLSRTFIMTLVRRISSMNA